MPTHAPSRWQALRHGLRRSLQLRILIALVGVLLLGFATLALYIIEARDDLRRLVAYLHAQEIARSLSQGRPLDELPLHHAGGEMSYTLYSAAGEPLWYSANLSRPRRLWRELWPEQRPLLRWPRDRGWVVNVPVHLPDGTILMVARQDVEERRMIGEQLHARLRDSLIMLIPVGLVVMLLVLALLRWTLRPIRYAARLARDIGPATPQNRLPVQSLPLETRELADAANNALDRLAQAYQSERQFVADAAHALRTPLAVLSLRTQALRRQLTQDWSLLDQDLQHMQRVVEQLLTLARQEGQQAHAAGTPTRVPLSRLVREATAAVYPLFEQAGRSLAVDVQDGLSCHASPAGITDMVANLLDNARVHGSGRVTLTLRRTGQDIELSIQDEGPGPAQPDAMFERFRKAVAGSTGTGLGLAIVRQVAANLGGQARFVPQRQGCMVSVRWPALHPDAPAQETLPTNR